MTGTKVKKLYEDTTGTFTVCKCAVGYAGDKLYVSSNYHHKLLTLASDGTVMSELSDCALQHPHTVHVTTCGQVIVCGHTSNSFIQADSKGQKKIASLLTQEGGVVKPSSVCYRENTIIVGLLDNDQILVFTIKK
ncbi:hypothetical protein DPMN_090344 [Dreissena polymorpha]|uniref:Uncharacterized protein n=1 Tax=Dreissena polymorpha TaxID=45954 RepID=A0A9D4QYY0_DREPO|nr:hypothetical protein DPMN_090344 [Dreissena polymorpha]